MDKLLNQNGIVIDELMEVYKMNPECAYKALALHNGCPVIKYPDNYGELPNLNNEMENAKKFCEIIKNVVLDKDSECYQEAKRFFWINAEKVNNKL